MLTETFAVQCDDSIHSHHTNNHTNTNDNDNDNKNKNKNKTKKQPTSPPPFSPGTIGSDDDPNDSTKCDAVCAYLRRLLGATGTVDILGQLDTRDDKVIKFKLVGDIADATIPLNEAGAELEDFGQ